MGFWNGLTKIIQGRPVFENPQVDSISTASQQTTSVVNDNQGRKTIPEITLEHCKTHINGDTIEVTAWATNISELEVELDKIVMIGQKTELDRWLKPGQGHEVRLFHGPIQQNNHQHTANLIYKLVSNGDYFQADYTIEYNRESNGTFSVEDFHLVRPVRDI